MKKSAFFRKSLHVVPLILFSQFATTDAFARPEYVGPTTGATACVNCHTSSNGDKNNVKPQALAAFNAAGLAGLKNWLKGCPTGTTLNPTTFRCVAPVLSAVSSSVGLSTSGAARTDVYAVTCGTGTAKLSVAVKDLPPVKASVVSIQAAKGFLASPLSADAMDGDAAGAASPAVTLAAGAGIYNVLVNKQLSATIGTELYTVQYACLNAAGAKTATSAAVIKQNQ